MQIIWPVFPDSVGFWECRGKRGQLGEGWAEDRDVYIKWPLSWTLRDEQEFCYLEFARYPCG